MAALRNMWDTRTLGCWCRPAARATAGRLKWVWLLRRRLGGRCGIALDRLSSVVQVREYLGEYGLGRLRSGEVLLHLQDVMLLVLRHVELHPVVGRSHAVAREADRSRVHVGRE